jgi:lysozyme
MKTSRRGVQFITDAEGFKTKAYQDSKGLWTIGVGHLIKCRENKLNGVSMPDTERHLLTKTLTRQEVENLLAADLIEFEKAVNDSIIVKVSQWEFDAMVSLAFNIGAKGFSGSTVKKRVNTFSKPSEIAKAFMMWNKPKELITTGRRAKEANLFENADYNYHDIAESTIENYNQYA